MKKLLIQLTKFGLVGVIATIIDFALLYIATDWLHIHYLISAALSFTVSTLFNYWASMTHVFETKFGPDERHKELVIFISLSIIGLGLNQVLMWLFVEQLMLYYMIAKILATFFVMAWNFISRKIFIEKR